MDAYKDEEYVLCDIRMNDAIIKVSVWRVLVNRGRKVKLLTYSDRINIVNYDLLTLKNNKKYNIHIK